MTTPSDENPTDWDLSVLDHPTIVDLPDTLPENPDPLVSSALDAVVAFFLHDLDRCDRLARLAHTGIVALRSSTGTLEIHETLLGWTLTHAAGTPDPHDLAAAARLRAHRLTGERHHHRGTPQ